MGYVNFLEGNHLLTGMILQVDDYQSSTEIFSRFFFSQYQLARFPVRFPYSTTTLSWVPPIELTSAVYGCQIPIHSLYDNIISQKKNPPFSKKYSLPLIPK